MEINEKVAKFENEDIFFKKYEHKLKIKDDQPFINETYAIPMRLRELVISEINKLLNLGIIRRSNSHI